MPSLGLQGPMARPQATTESRHHRVPASNALSWRASSIQLPFPELVTSSCGDVAWHVGRGHPTCSAARDPVPLEHPRPLSARKPPWPRLRPPLGPGTPAALRGKVTVPSGSSWRPACPREAEGKETHFSSQKTDSSLTLFILPVHSFPPVPQTGPSLSSLCEERPWGDRVLLSAMSCPPLFCLPAGPNHGAIIRRSPPGLTGSSLPG